MVASVRTNAVRDDDARFERKTAKDSSPFFTLKAANGEIIGKSEMYSSAAALENGISSVKKVRRPGPSSLICRRARLAIRYWPLATCSMSMSSQRLAASDYYPFTSNVIFTFTRQLVILPSFTSALKFST